MAREFETDSTGAPAPHAGESEPDVTHNAPSGELIVQGRTVIDPAEAHDLEVRGVTVIDKGRRSYRNKLVNRGRTVIDRRSEQ
ncbi:MAG TPA: hypothetical protein VFM49_04120 [Chloroflexia bacterium]|jgi:hypothetical protein|nr:hypothetical protein [Chloroflexia bacterium]